VISADVGKSNFHNCSEDFIKNKNIFFKKLFKYFSRINMHLKIPKSDLILENSF
jgi:hypothetical protein